MAANGLPNISTITNPNGHYGSWGQPCEPFYKAFVTPRGILVKSFPATHSHKKLSL